MALKPETIREIEKLAAEMGEAFSPPELIPGCEVKSVADKDQYAADNGWIEAVCGQHNNQRCRWKGKFSGVQVGDYVDVLYFRSIQLFEVFAKGGTGSISPAGGWPFTNVLTVDPSDADADYTTITLAIAGATAGDAIWIGNATYSENVTVNKKLYLIGASREGVIIDGTFTTTTADCVIENLTIFRDDAGSSDVNIFTAGADATLRRVNLSGLTVTTTGALNGIYNVNTYEITAEDCTIELADTSSSATHGVYVDAAGAVVNVVGGIVDAQSSGGSAYDVRINEDGTINLRDPELVNNTLDAGGGTINGQYTTGGVLYSLDDIISTNDVYPQSSTNGINTRFENLFGDDVPADPYQFTYRTFSVNNVSSNIVGFEDNQASPYTPPAGNFSITTPANTTSQSSNHWIDLFNQTSATPCYLQWTNATAKNTFVSIFAVTPFATGADTLISEARFWDVQTPTANDRWWAVRFVYYGATKTQWPFNVSMWYSAVVGDGLTFGTATGTKISESPIIPGNVYRLGFIASAGPFASCNVLAIEGFDTFVASATVASMPVSIKTARLMTFQSFNQFFVDQLVVT